MGMAQLPPKQTTDIGTRPHYDREEKIRAFDTSQERLKNLAIEDEKLAERIRTERVATRLAEQERLKQLIIDKEERKQDELK